MRVAVHVFGLGEQGDVAGDGVGCGEFFQDREVGGAGLLRLQFLDGLEAGDADEIGGNLAVVEVATVVADRAVDGQVVFEAGEIILGAVAGGGVHAAGAAVGGDVVGEDDRRGAVDEGVAGGEAFEARAEDAIPNYKVLEMDRIELKFDVV